MYTLHKMYQRLLHPTNSTRLHILRHWYTHTSQFTFYQSYTYHLPVDFLQDGPLKLLVPFLPELYMHIPVQTSMYNCYHICTYNIQYKTLVYNHYLLSTYINLFVHFPPNPTYLTFSTFSSMYICYLAPTRYIPSTYLLRRSVLGCTATCIQY